jgi:hypothetical protein
MIVRDIRLSSFSGAADIRVYLRFLENKSIALLILDTDHLYVSNTVGSSAALSRIPDTVNLNDESENHAKDNPGKVSSVFAGRTWPERRCPEPNPEAANSAQRFDSHL